MSGPQNIVIGDNDSPMNVPQTQVPEEALTEEKKMAKYSETAEFKRLKEFMEARISFFQNYLPDGRPIKQIQLTEAQLAFNWKVANAVIEEFQGVLNAYDQARESVKEHAG